MPSPLLVGDEIYIVSDKGVATCLDAKSGQVHWTQLAAGQLLRVALFADGRIFFFNREGEATAIKPGPEFEKLGVNKTRRRLHGVPGRRGRRAVRADGQGSLSHSEEMKRVKE